MQLSSLYKALTRKFLWTSALNGNEKLAKSTATVKSCDNELWGHPNWLKDVMQKVADEYRWIMNPHHLYPFVTLSIWCPFSWDFSRFFLPLPSLPGLVTREVSSEGGHNAEEQEHQSGLGWLWASDLRRGAQESGKSWQVVASRGKSWQVVARGKSWHVASLGTWQVTRLLITSLDGNYPQHYQHSRSTSCTQHTQHISTHNQHLPKVSKLGLDLVWIRFLGGDSAIGPTRRLRSCLKTNCLRPCQGLPMFQWASHTVQ